MFAINNVILPNVSQKLGYQTSVADECMFSKLHVKTYLCLLLLITNLSLRQSMNETTFFMTYAEPSKLSEAGG